MAWFVNYYHCDECGTDWDDEWSCCCDDDCPGCGSRHWSPAASEDLTFVIEFEDGVYEIYESPIIADDEPSYELIAVTLTEGAARSYVALRAATYWQQVIPEDRYN